MISLSKITFLAALLSLQSAFGTEPAQAQSVAPQPNFIVILGEGQGWSSLSVPMAADAPSGATSAIPTPNLDRLAESGIRFSNGYAASPRCTPSRAGLLTGITPGDLHMTFVGDGRNTTHANPSHQLQTPNPVLELPTEVMTIAELLKSSGYATAHFGKWHLGKASPSQHGFDESDGPTNNGGPDNVANPNPKQALGMTQRGIGFMNRQTAAQRPFYLQLSHYPSQPEKGGSKADRPDLKDTVDIVDQTVGELLDAVDRLGIATRTYIVYTTDHGSPGNRSNLPLSLGKGSVKEGGIRVPFLVRGPGIAADTFSTVRISSLDILPTFAALAHAAIPDPSRLEGGNIAPALFAQDGATIARSSDAFVVHFPHYDKDPAGPATALIQGNYKLIQYYEQNQPQLYDLSRDPSERSDFAAKLPEKTAALENALQAYLAKIKADLPTPNPKFDPDAQPSSERKGKRSGDKTKNEKRSKNSAP